VQAGPPTSQKSPDYGRTAPDSGRTDRNGVELFEFDATALKQQCCIVGGLGRLGTWSIFPSGKFALYWTELTGRLGVARRRVASCQMAPLRPLGRCLVSGTNLKCFPSQEWDFPGIFLT